MIENMMGGMNRYRLKIYYPDEDFLLYFDPKSSFETLQSSSMTDDSEDGSEEEESLIGSNGQLNMNSIMNMANSMMSGMNRPNQGARRPAPTPR